MKDTWIDVDAHRFQLWPGYITRMQQYEYDFLVGVKVAHKIMRTETVHDIWRRCLNDGSGDYQLTFRRHVIGITVLIGNKYGYILAFETFA